MAAVKTRHAVAAAGLGDVAGVALGAIERGGLVPQLQRLDATRGSRRGLGGAGVKLSVLLEVRPQGNGDGVGMESTRWAPKP